MRILGLCGSLRKGSYNKLALGQALAIAKSLGHEIIGEGDLNLPLYNGDIDTPETTPAAVRALIGLAQQADVVFIASPEYNHSYTGVLKNALDWLSRGSKPLKGKVAAMFGASSGIMGSVRSQIHLRQVLSNLDIFSLPKPEVYVREAEVAFDAQGMLKDQKTVEQLTKLITETLAFAQKLKA